MKLTKVPAEYLAKLCILRPGAPPGCISTRRGLAAVSKLVTMGLARETEPLTRWNRDHTYQYTTRRFEATEQGRAMNEDPHA
jgi:hypothetical protein